MTQPKEVTIYTDGACLGNPGPGGYGVVLLYGEHRRELSGGFRRTTNNRMEILAAIAGLEALKGRCKVTLYTDSQYLVNTIMKGWAERWKKYGWTRNKKREAARNPDLWERLLELCSKHEVEFRWVRGHSGVEENERADQLSVEAASGKNLAVDLGYEDPDKVMPGARRETFLPMADS
jgi:ribonuclease HI